MPLTTSIIRTNDKLNLSSGVGGIPMLAHCIPVPRDKKKVFKILESYAALDTHILFSIATNKN